MPGIVALRDLISLDCTTSLVAAGYVAPWLLPGTASSSSDTTLTITDATNASPIVITTSIAHGIPATEPAHVVISGVLGNTAANNYDSSSDVDRAWVAVPLSSTTFALYSVDVSSGRLAASTGNGAYTGRGTVKKAFVDGRILLGRQHAFAQSTPPRVVMIPMRGNFTVKDVFNRSQLSGFPSSELQRQIKQRSIRTEQVVFEVHVWGATNPPDPDSNFDATQVLYQQVIRSAHLLNPGNYELQDGAWQDQHEGETQLVVEGHHFVFGLVLGTPVLDVALGIAPTPVNWIATTNLQPSDGGATNVGCSDA